MSIGFSYMKGTCQKLQCILVTDKTRSTFSTGKTLHELLCKLKDRVDTEDKENIAYKIYFNTFEAICSNDANDFSKLRSVKLNRSVKNFDNERNIIAERCLEKDHDVKKLRKYAFFKESRTNRQNLQYVP